ncbi:membrane protein UL45 [Leporid alphaherpesvirus 4]|uniref:Membrane protein UL45 n=1 Tax=Leporid alphaherpesvirus 4 TaxID=481315 RepID=J9QYP6_9ALPH|nr:membrane protein UL45 [Leporid alphaherpesvirus 4]AFR32488.1 membrane protein UL45 [Leporid alphaherpesvirus 4]
MRADAAAGACKTVAAAVVVLVLGSLLTIAVVALALPNSAWTTLPCAPGWMELGLGCVSGESALVPFRQAASNCSAPGTLIPSNAAAAMALMLRTYARNPIPYIWVRNDGVKACVRVADGMPGINESCAEQAARVCHYYRSPGRVAQFVLRVRGALGLP